MEFVLETLRAENDKLEEIVEQNHTEIMTIKKEIHDAEKDLQKVWKTYLFIFKIFRVLL